MHATLNLGPNALKSILVVGTYCRNNAYPRLARDPKFEEAMPSGVGNDRKKVREDSQWWISRTLRTCTTTPIWVVHRKVVKLVAEITFTPEELQTYNSRR